MKAIVTTATAAVLCCSMSSLPTLSLVASPPTRMRSRWPEAPLSSAAQQCAIDARQPHNPCSQTRAGPNAYLGGINREREKRASLARDECCCCCCCFSRTGGTRSQRRPPRSFLRRRDWAIPSKGLPLEGFLSSLRESDDAAFDNEEEKILSFEEFEKALVLNAPGGDGGSGGTGAQQHAATGIRWRSLIGDILTQPLFFGIFAWLATPAIREQVKASFRVTLSGAGLGILGSLPLFAYGLALETRRDWAWVRTAEAATERAVLNLFGSKRQVTKVSAVSIPLAVLVGLSEEFGFRGFLPLILAAKTGLPTATVVVLSGIFCGLLHAVSWAYFINAALNGMFFHGLLLSTGNIFVPVVAHAVHNAFALVHCHLKTSRPPTAVMHLDKKGRNPPTAAEV